MKVNYNASTDQFEVTALDEFDKQPVRLFAVQVK